MFNYDDALTFYSIGYECHHYRIATLAGILLTTDAINRSTPFREELEDALNKLLASGYIEPSGEGYVLTLAGKKTYDRHPTKLPEITVFDAIHDVQREFAKKHPVTENSSMIKITDKQYRNARKGMRTLFKNS